MGASAGFAGGSALLPGTGCSHWVDIFPARPRSHLLKPVAMVKDAREVVLNPGRTGELKKTLMAVLRSNRFNEFLQGGAWASVLLGKHHAVADASSQAMKSPNPQSGGSSAK